MASLNTIGVSSGCTPCECGVPGACLQEQLPSFLQSIPTYLVHYSSIFVVTIIAVFVPALIARIILKKIFKRGSPFIINTVSVLIGSFFVIPYIFSYFNPNTFTDLANLIAPAISIALIYLVFIVFDARSNKIPLKNSFFGILIIFTFVFSISFALKTLVEIHSKQITAIREESISNVIQSLDLTQKVEQVEMLLKNRDYLQLQNYLSPNEKIRIHFRFFDGEKFSKQEFYNILNNNKLSEVAIHRQVNFSINVAQLLDGIKELLQDEYEIDYYIDDSKHVDENQDITNYSKVDFLYHNNTKKAILTFSKSSDSNWYLSRINYHDENLTK